MQVRSYRMQKMGEFNQLIKKSAYSYSYISLLHSLNSGYLSYQDYRKSLELTRLDPSQLQSSLIHSVVLSRVSEYIEEGRLSRIAAYSEAERLLNDYLNIHGDEALILGVLAKIYYMQEKLELSYKTLQTSLTLNPTIIEDLLAFENHKLIILPWFFKLIERHSGNQAVINILDSLLSSKHKKYVSFLLAKQKILSNTDDQEYVLKYCRKMIHDSNANSETLIFVCDMLNETWNQRMLIELIHPIYKPDKHDIAIGIQLLWACKTESKDSLARKILQDLEQAQDNNLNRLIRDASLSEYISYLKK